MTTSERTTVHDAAGGAQGLLALAHVWHARCLADPEAAHPFERGGHPQHLERLAAYWGEALGGPTTYSTTMADESHVLRLHACNGEHRSLDAAALACFDQALTDVGITEDPLRRTLHDYFAHGIGRMAAHPDSADAIPDGLAVPRWTWDGPVRDA